ncbi:MAG: AtpZ/AtpI family protein [Rickettsiaceae bacterium]|nr:AtpZ/AtpI family protein [Rickettsiaceae bacterium]
MNKDEIKKHIKKLEDKANKFNELENGKKFRFSSHVLALEIVVTISFCSFIGWKLDMYFTTKPILFIIFLIIGIFVQFKNILR